MVSIVPLRAQAGHKDSIVVSSPIDQVLVGQVILDKLTLELSKTLNLKTCNRNLVQYIYVMHSFV